ncbi:hypothetical protein [Burkholderia multivorans]|uniref:hypothetical protein n=1 Tax=Burkholderia multivorans TaxID=87883 RepID=UPI0021BEFCE2|nr:hypothetical protein [Burkholderia multivorans]
MSVFRVFTNNARASEGRRALVWSRTACVLTCWISGEKHHEETDSWIARCRRDAWRVKRRVGAARAGDQPIYASQHGAQAVAHTTLVDSLDPVRGVVANVIVTIDPGAISHEIG